MRIKELLPKKLKTLIKEKFKQQKIFAEKIHVGETQVTNWIKGNVIPSVETLEKISDLCDIHISYFFNDASNSEILNEDIFNEVFVLAYNFADENNIEINGSYFLGCYDAVVTTIYKESTSVEEAFNQNKRLILKLVKKR